MRATHPKYEWSRADIDEARGSALDFDNIFQVIPINPHAGYIQGRFVVFRRTSGKSEQSPTWYPGRDLKKELEANYRKARKRAKVILADLKKLREARESLQTDADEKEQNTRYDAEPNSRSGLSNTHRTIGEP